jgi:hypothetical protein
MTRPRKGRAAVNQRPHLGHGHAPGGSGKLDEYFMRRLIDPGESDRSDHSFLSDNSRFDLQSAGRMGDHRGDAGF